MNWQTTLTGIVTGIATILAHFNIILPDSWQTIIIAIGAALLGIFAADAKQLNQVNKP